MIDYFIQQGITNPHRVKSLIEDIINFFKLNLTGLIVFTEAASKNYVITPIIAAKAGAKVYAIASDSQYGKARNVEEFTYKFAEFCGVKDNIDIVFKKEKQIINQANIITNLGFVRPIDKGFIDKLNKNAVIPYMCEAWEYRDGDIDLGACNNKKIPVMATNEDFQGLEVFDNVGFLCMKMLFKLEIEVYKSKILIVSGDKFGRVIEKYLKAAGAKIILIENLISKENRKYLEDCDALVVADYISDSTFIGKNAQISVKEIIELSRKISVIQFAGDVDIEELDNYYIPYVPKKRVGKSRMGMTLAQLGPKPVIDLHCAGLKVGEIMAKARLNGINIEQTRMMALKYSPAQILE